MVDFADFAASHDSLKAARAGDLRPISNRLEQGKLAPDEIAWLVAELRGDHARGRKHGSQSRNGQMVKALFANNSELDLATFEAVEHLQDVAGLGVLEARRKIALLLGETDKNVKARIARLRQHLEAGKSLSSYVDSGGVMGAFLSIRAALKQSTLSSELGPPLLVALLPAAGN